MPEPDQRLRIALIQRDADDAALGAAIKIEKLGGAVAVEGYLNHSLSLLLGVAIEEIGTQGANDLLAGGLQTLREYAERARSY